MWFCWDAKEIGIWPTLENYGVKMGFRWGKWEVVRVDGVDGVDGVWLHGYSNDIIRITRSSFEASFCVLAIHGPQ